MPEYVLNRNHVLRTTNGVISFVKGEPAWVTPQMEKDAVAIGAQRVDGDSPDPLGDEEKPAPVAPTGDERKDQFFAAFELMVEKNDAKEFTGQGVPTVKAIEKLLGFDADGKEIALYWTEFKTAKAEQQ